MRNILKKIFLLVIALQPIAVQAQVNTDQVMKIGRNSLYIEDYLLAIQYFNQVIAAKPFLPEPYFYRAVAKISLGDNKGAAEDCTLALDINPFIIDAYQVRGIARQTLGQDSLAIADYAAGLKMNPEDKVLLLNKAVCEQNLKKYDEAEATYSSLIKYFPKNDRAYVARAYMWLSKGDTVKALADVDKSLSLSKKNSGVYALRAQIKMQNDDDFEGALADIDEAIKLDSKFSGYFINRAFVKYKLEDFFGAMSDYDYALDLEPGNVTAHYNRGLLRAEVKDNNRAIEDFTYVLGNNPENFHARYNRALLYYYVGQYKNAIKDFDKVLEKYPDFEAGLYARSECKRLIGDMAGGEQDYNKSKSLQSKKRKYTDTHPGMDEDVATEEVETESAVMNKFNTLLTVDNTTEIADTKYDSMTRGRVQDRNVQIDPEPAFMLSFYDINSKVKETTNYVKEVAELNEMALLRFTLVVTNGDSHLFQDEINNHFASIEYYNSLLAEAAPRAIDYFARAMDFLMVKNPEAAVVDLNRAVAMSEDFVLAYFARANANYMLYRMMQSRGLDETNDPNIDLRTRAMLREKENKKLLDDIIADYDKVLKLSPKNVYAVFNKGNMFMLQDDYTSAISCYTNAINEKPDFGEAYYNRGMMYFKLGNKDRGMADLSKAGELGIMSSYNVLKRMSR